MSTCAILVIGGSAGALDALLRFLPAIRNDLPFPVVVILHRGGSHDSMLADVLAARCPLEVREIEDKDKINGGTVYLVPGDYHCLIEKEEVFSLDASAKVNYSRPSIDVTFESAANVYGENCVAILLSGGNTDGTVGLLKILEKGGRTCVQDPSSAQVSYMPAEAARAFAAQTVLTPEEMAAYINVLA